MEVFGMPYRGPMVRPQAVAYNPIADAIQAGFAGFDEQRGRDRADRAEARATESHTAQMRASRLSAAASGSALEDQGVREGQIPDAPTYGAGGGLDAVSRAVNGMRYSKLPGVEGFYKDETATPSARAKADAEETRTRNAAAEEGHQRALYQGLPAAVRGRLGAYQPGMRVSELIRPAQDDLKLETDTREKGADRSSREKVAGEGNASRERIAAAGRRSAEGIAGANRANSREIANIRMGGVGSQRGKLTENEALQRAMEIVDDGDPETPFDQKSVMEIAKALREGTMPVDPSQITDPSFRPGTDPFGSFGQHLAPPPEKPNGTMRRAAEMTAPYERFLGAQPRPMPQITGPDGQQETDSSLVNRAAVDANFAAFLRSKGYKITQ